MAVASPFAAVGHLYDLLKLCFRLVNGFGSHKVSRINAGMKKFEFQIKFYQFIMIYGILKEAFIKMEKECRSRDKGGTVSNQWKKNVVSEAKGRSYQINEKKMHQCFPDDQCLVLSSLAIPAKKFRGKHHRLRWSRLLTGLQL